MLKYLIVSSLLLGSFRLAMPLEASSNSLPANQTNAPMNFIGISPFFLLPIIMGSSAFYYELDYGRKLDDQSYFGIAADFYKYATPMAMPYSDTNHYPGSIVSSGLVFAYQRFIWDKFFILPIINFNLISYYDGDNKFIQNGFLLLFCFRVGYHFDFEICKLPFYLEAGVEVNYWPLNLNEPQGFKEVENKYNIYSPSPALNFGYKF